MFIWLSNSKRGFDLHHQHLDQDSNQEYQSQDDNQEIRSQDDKQEIRSQNDEQKIGARKSFAAQVSFSESETCETESNNSGTRKSANVQVSFTDSENFDTESEKYLVEKTAILKITFTSDESETSPKVIMKRNKIFPFFLMSNISISTVCTVYAGPWIPVVSNYLSGHQVVR